MQSVIQEPPKGSGPALGDLVVFLASVADEIQPWGSAPGLRDRQLRAFWPSEPYLCSAIFAIASRFASFPWEIDGPERTAAIVQKRLHDSEGGQGWIPLIIKTVLDLATQDNAAFIEMVRTADSPTASVIQLNHLDSGRCIRTGRKDVPVLYRDIKGALHEMKWYQVMMLSEMPSPIEDARGLQYCVVTRVLRKAQEMRNISIYMREKMSGKNSKAIHLVSGVQRKSIEDGLRIAREESDNRGETIYQSPAIIAALDPTATVSKQTIELASLPDGFDMDVELRHYIMLLALAFGTDYQDFAPLPGGGLGTASQSGILHQKSRGKGPALFMENLTHLFNFHGIMPDTCRFKFAGTDLEEESANVAVAVKRGQERAIRINSGEITTQVARQRAFEAGDLTNTDLAMMATEDQSPDVELRSDEPPDILVPNPTEITPGPDAQPTAPTQNSTPNPSQRVI